MHIIKTLIWTGLCLFAALPTHAFEESVLGQGGVIIENDPRLRFPVPQPSFVPLIHNGQANLEELVQEGEKNWFFDAPLEGEPFSLSEKLLNYFLGKPGTPKHERLVRKFTKIAGLTYFAGEEFPRGLVRVGVNSGLVTQNCSACHSGSVNGHFIPGLANKWYDQKAIIKNARTMMEVSIPLLKIQGEKSKELLKQTQVQLKKLKRYEALYGIGCRDLAPGMITAARIWEISSKLLSDPKQLSTQEGRDKFLCGSTKPPALNTLKFRNIYFWDGSVNTAWVAHWPMFDFFGFDDYKRWEKKIETRAIQSVDAFLTFGTKSPPWREIMHTSIDTERASRGYSIFHRSQSCVSCHGTYSQWGMLQKYKPTVTPIEDIQTDSERTDAAFDDLLAAFAQYGWAYVPRLDGLQKDYPHGYQAYPLCSTFLNYPYLHTGAVANLDELLLPSEKRKTQFWLSETIDEVHVGFFTSIPSQTSQKSWSQNSILRKFRKELSNGHSGERYGTNLNPDERRDLVEYLKTLRCPDY